MHQFAMGTAIDRSLGVTLQPAEHELAALIGRRERPRPIRRVRLVLLIRVLTFGGAERQLTTLVKSLDREVFDVTVVCLYTGGVFANELADAGVRIISLEKKGRWEVVRFLWRLATVLRKLHPDILHSYLTGQNLMAMAMKPLLPSTRIVWGVRDSNIDPGKTDWLAKPLFRLEVLLSRLADLIIFNSLAGEQCYVSAGFRVAPRLVIRNGIDTARFAPDRESGDILRALWKIPKGTLVIGIVGRLDPVKDHSHFLRAAALFSKSRPDARFVCVGGGADQYTRELRVLSEQLGLGDKVVWAGFIEDMTLAYNALDICCCCSADGEGTANCVAEAMACGVPCVVTDVGDLRFVVGETGILVPIRDPESLAAGWVAMVQRIERDPKVADAARARVMSELDVSMLVEKTSNALLGII
jgi:glycosyltransferase involved in cell wall biosynthesis